MEKRERKKERGMSRSRRRRRRGNVGEGGNSIQFWKVVYKYVARYLDIEVLNRAVIQNVNIIITSNDRR